MNNKEKYIRDCTNRTLEEVVRTLSNRERKKGILVRPTGFGKSFLLSNLTSNKELIRALEEKYHTPEYSHGNMDRTKLPVRFLYVYPTDVIKKSVIDAYGAVNGMGTLKNTYFVSYSIISRAVDELKVKADKSEYASNRYVFEIKNKNKTEYIKLTNNKNDGKSYNIKFKAIVGEDNIYEITTNKKANEHYEINTISDLTEFFASFDIIMLDECHRAAADGFSLAYSSLDRAISDDANYSWVTTQLIGVTATPYRLDGRDIGDIFGKRNNGRLIGSGLEDDITLSDAIKAGLMNKFDYMYAVLNKDNFVKQVTNEINSSRKTYKNEEVTELTDIEKVKLDRAGQQIPSLSDVLHTRVKPGYHSENEDYMKFVVFFSDKNALAEQAEDVYNEFYKAFPDFNVTPTITVSDSNLKVMINGREHSVSKLDDLSKLERIPNRKIVDLILCVDQLNMGYHVPDITGVVLLRATKSAVVYNQQIGRCFSIKAKNTPIIIDIVDKYNEILSSLKDAKNKDKDNLGEQTDLPSILSRDCVNIIDETKSFLKEANAIKNQTYDKLEEFISFWKNDRNAPIEVIAHILDMDVEAIKKYY